VSKLVAFMGRKIKLCLRKLSHMKNRVVMKLSLVGVETMLYFLDDKF